jgi:serine/threonine-protein kinase RsbW
VRSRMAPNLNFDRAQRDTGRRSLNLILESTTDNTNVAASRVVQFARRLGYSKQQCQDIELVVREVVANAILHGNHCNCNKHVLLTAKSRTAGLVICIQDEGEGFDPASVPDPLKAEGLQQESGRGLLLINAYMDEVVWRRSPGGMEVTLTKYSARRRATPCKHSQEA